MFDLRHEQKTSRSCITLLLAVAGIGGAAHAQGTFSWQQVMPAHSPSPRGGSNGVLPVAHDPVRQVTLLQGGVNTPLPQNETWQWDGVDWTQRFPAHAPQPGSGNLCFHAGLGQLVHVGGPNGQVETWSWDGQDWIDRTGAVLPPNRAGHGLACDAQRQRLVLFGGDWNGMFRQDTWTWDGTQWTLAGSGGPSPRSGAGMVYDAAHQCVVLFGGLSANGWTALADTWTWDGMQWTQRTTAHAPSARQAASMVFDAARQLVVLWGGGGNFVETNETWLWDGTDWQQLATTNAPSARAYQGLAYDLARDRLVMFGGAGLGGPRNDTWELIAGTGPAATYTTFGAGCAGWAGMPWLTANGMRPLLGQPFPVFLYNLPPDHSTLSWIGLSNTSWAGNPLPLDLAPIGAPGCTLLAAPDVAQPVFNWGGYATWTWLVPAQPTLAGLHFYNQAAAIDHSNALGLVFTNAGDGRLGAH